MYGRDGLILDWRGRSAMQDYPAASAAWLGIQASLLPGPFRAGPAASSGLRLASVPGRLISAWALGGRGAGIQGGGHDDGSHIHTVSLSGLMVRGGPLRMLGSIVVLNAITLLTRLPSGRGCHAWPASTPR